MWIWLLKYFLKIITSVQLHFDPVIEATIFSPSYQTSLAISTPISCQMFFPMQPEWVFHNVYQLKPPIPHAFCSMPNALRGFLCLRLFPQLSRRGPARASCAFCSCFYIILHFRALHWSTLAFSILPFIVLPQAFAPADPQQEDSVQFLNPSMSFRSQESLSWIFD